jgi:hypothetical protein
MDTGKWDAVYNQALRAIVSLSPNSSDAPLSLPSQIMRIFCQVSLNPRSPLASPHSDCIHILMNLSFDSDAWFTIVEPDQFSRQLLQILNLSFAILSQQSHLSKDLFSTSAMLNGAPLDIALSPSIYLLHNLAQSDPIVCSLVKNEIFPDCRENSKIGDSFGKLMTHPGQSRLRVVLEDLVFVLFDKNRESPISCPLFEY